MTQHWWDRFRFGRSDILETPPSPEYIPGVLESNRIRPQPFNPLLSGNNSPEESEKLREELHRLGLLHLVNNPREEQEKIKEYIEYLKKDMSEGFGIPRNTLFGRIPTHAQVEAQMMIRESNRLAIENPSERSLEESNEAADYVNAFTRAAQTLRRACNNIPVSLTGAARSPTSQTLEEFFNSMHELHRTIVPLTEVFAEAVTPLVDALIPTMDTVIDNRSIGTQELCSCIESAHLRTIPRIYYDGVDEEYIIFFGGGRHEDNDVRAQGDFLYTISFGIMKLKEKGCDASLFNIFTNRRLLEIAESDPHLYHERHIAESDRVRQRTEINSWITDDNLPDVIIIQPIRVNGSRIPLMVAITGILNCSNVLPVRDGIIQSGPRIGQRVDRIGIDRGAPVVGSAIIEGPRVEGGVLNDPVVRSGIFRAQWESGSGGTARTIDLDDVVSIVTPQMTEMEEAISKLKIVDRDCWLCGNSINYKECCEANTNLIHKEVSALWNNPIAKIACCSCTEKLSNLVRLQKKSGVEYISVSKDTKTKYLVKEDRFVNYSKISRIVLEFTTGGRISFMKNQFENLIKYKIIDFPIELEVDVLEPEREKANRADDRDGWNGDTCEAPSR